MGMHVWMQEEDTHSSYPTNLAAANATVMTKLAENEVPMQGFVSEAEFVQGPCGCRGPQLARTPNPGALSRVCAP